MITDIKSLFLLGRWSDDPVILIHCVSALLRPNNAEARTVTSAVAMVSAPVLNGQGNLYILLRRRNGPSFSYPQQVSWMEVFFSYISKSKMFAEDLLKQVECSFILNVV